METLLCGHNMAKVYILTFYSFFWTVYHWFIWISPFHSYFICIYTDIYIHTSAHTHTWLDHCVLLHSDQLGKGNSVTNGNKLKVVYWRQPYVFIINKVYHYDLHTLKKIFFFHFVTLEFELRASHLLGRHSIIWATP
jgi:hypothetical protein